MRVLKIIKGTAADGPGLRNTVYVAGCIHKCPGCHNPESWDMSAGKQMSPLEVFQEVYDDFANVTFSGGDPILQWPEVLEVCRYLKEHGKNIWLYTGYKYEEVVTRAPEILKVVDVLVDGRYDQTKREVTKRFAGSTNQRIIHLKNGKIDFIE